MLLTVELRIALIGGKARDDARSLGVVGNGIHLLDEIIVVSAHTDEKGLTIALQDVAHQVRLSHLALTVCSDGRILALCICYLAQFAPLLHELEESMFILFGLILADPAK